MLLHPHAKLFDPGRALFVARRNATEVLADHARQLAARAFGEEVLGTVEQPDEEQRARARALAGQRIATGRVQLATFRGGVEPRDRVVVAHFFHQPA